MDSGIATASGVTARPPAERELAVLRRYLESQTALFSARPEEAARLLALGEKKSPSDIDKTELASWTMVASLLLNLDEAITRQ